MKCKSGVMTPLVLDNDLANNGVSLYVSQASDATDRWRFRVIGQDSSGAVFNVGTVFSSPPNATSERGMPNRLIAIAYVPGVVRWTVEVNVVSIEGEEPEAAIDVWLASSEYNGGILGLRRVGERFKAYSDDEGPIVLDYGSYPTSWAAVTGAAPGSVTVQRGPDLLWTTPIPANSAVSGDIPPGSIMGGVSFQFTDTESYLLETLESA